MSFAVLGSHVARRIKTHFDIVISYQLSPITMVYPAIIYKNKHKCPLLLYCLDIWPESVQAHVGSDTGILYKFISKISKSIYQKCDRILVTSSPFITYLAEKNQIPKEKLAYLPQHANDEYVSMDLAAPENGIADFMYAGNLGHGQVLHNIILAAAEIKERDDFLIHIVGDGSCAEELKQLADEKGVSDKVIFYGNKPRSEMPDLYRKADALLITLRGNNFVGTTMPGKLQTYMATGKPIFGAINGAANDVITEAECGKCVAADDYKGLAMLMKDYIDNSEKYYTCGDKAKAYFKKHFTLDAYIHGLEDSLKKLF
jgi:glycosyltransferase involved in cell wall biosynthesis